MMIGHRVTRCLALAAGAGLLAGPPLAAAASCALGTGRLTICTGAYALCTAASCKSPSKVTDPAPVAECECPVLTGQALANPDQLPGGSCAAPAGRVYALFATAEQPGKGTMSCPGGAFAQCWNASCSWKQGDKVAHCSCPLCTGTFVTAGGGCDASSCVRQLLVAVPFSSSGGECR